MDTTAVRAAPDQCEVRMVRDLIVLLMLLGVGACGGSSPVTPAVQYPDLVGAWNGTLTIKGADGAINNVCPHSWNVTGQNGGAFSGITSTGGGNCRTGSGTVSGSATPDGNLSLGPGILPLDSVCVRLSSGGYVGSVAGSSVSATLMETVRCTTGSPTPFEFTRSIVLALQR